MTEAEWLECTDPMPMLGGLLERRRLSNRWKQLFACACCRRSWPLLTDPRSRKAVETAERFCDGLGSLMELQVAAQEAYAAIPTGHPSRRVSVGGKAWRDRGLRQCVTLAAWFTTGSQSLTIAWRGVFAEVAEQRGLAAGGEHWQCGLLRDIIGNPFRPVALNPAWQTPTVLALAQAAYDNRILPGGTLEPARLAVLADSLEEVGCDN